MPPRGRRNPELLTAQGEQGPELSPEEIDETEHAEPADPHEGETGPQMIYEGEMLTTSMTLAVVLPGDSKESYFGAKFTGRMQPEEDAELFSARCITVVRESAIGQLDDAIDSLAEYTANLAKSGRI